MTVRTIPLAVVCGVVLSWASAALSAQGPPRQPQPAGPTYVAIGCVTRQGTASAPRYVLTDRRGDSPTVYRLQGNIALVEPHVGHTLEAKGPIAPPPSAGGPQVLRVTSIVWLASSCKN